MTVLSLSEMPRVERGVSLLRALVHEIRTEKLTFMAGSIAYHAFVSLLPLFLLLLAIAATFQNQTVDDSVRTLAGVVLTEGTRDDFFAEATRATQSTGVSLFGGAVLLWGTLRIFRGLDTAFSDIYESEASNTFGDQIKDGILVLFTLAIVLVIGSVVNDTVGTVSSGTAAWLIGRLFLILGLTLALYPMYYVFPDTDVSLLEVVPGTLTAAVGLTVFESLFQLYTAVSNTAPNSSVVAGILVLLTWLYFSGLVILLGAAVNAVLSNRSRDVNVEPVFGGIPPEAKRHDGVSRTELVATVERLDKTLYDAEHVVVTVDGEEIPIPAPDRVVSDTESLRFLPGGAVSVELRWSPRDE
ncbi:YihY/virulence factor BrkB family protein [Halogeometricum borinquense]|uniref:YihY/virulence factor BrkB family protein n=1 Tax=Halogeometricum borinquense TaxID=60847 RepID=A0A6C0UHU9_9EURY|nr:YihY/virulence factor BrkB family protein [Halogeometricum borinquense]QIB75072.1 YihY/virulence factor BrkB family protein [Halogeometricum borinquense]QIQ75947.1 YihY/virulence factor BrkB family protein [Halogeometricum borinquense]